MESLRTTDEAAAAVQKTPNRVSLDSMRALDTAVLNALEHGDDGFEEFDDEGEEE